MTRIQFHLLTMVLLLGTCGHQAFAQSEGIPLAPPLISVWYGNNQSFGHIGNPVPAINILGNVSDPDGIASLRYTLNGSVAKSLTVGPDTRRLAKKGDFNIDIPYNTLLSGQNQVIITAVDNLNETSRDTVMVQYTSGMSWPAQYTADWSSATRISDVAQVVDGKWAIESNGLRTVGLGYDRLVGVGQTSWTNYEATVPMTILGLDSSGFQPPSNGAGIGFIIRWPGHSDLPVSLAGRQPKTGYLPLGAIGWYLWGTDMVPRLTLHGNNLALLDQDPVTQLTFNTTYMFKIRVETVAGQGGLYRMKVWRQGQPEPATWNLSGQQGLSDPQSGSLMIMAHHVDVRLGNIVVQPVGGSTPPAISNIQHLPTSGHASITWGTDQPATSSVAYGLTTSYELGTVTDNSFVTQHAVALSGLIPGTLYHYRVSSTNGTGQSSSSGDLTFSTTLQSNIVSDDFNALTLNTSIWRFINPLRDARYAMTNTNTADAALTISVPGGTAHDPWTSGVLAPRVVQDINNADFEIEFKTLTGMTLRYQQQGVVLQQGLKDFLRFEFYSDGSNTRLFAAYLINNVPTVIINNVIAPNNRAPLFMRILRSGNQWTQRYSFDGQTWVDGVSFSHPIVLSQLGLYAANAGSPAPAITASHDYFFNTASPIVPEDGVAPVITQHPANQTVAVGQVASFSVTASGSTPLTYQWQKNGSDIAGATLASYTTPATVQGDSGAAFRCRVTNTFGSITSNAAILNIASAPVITTHPANQTVALGSTATFSVVATGTAPLTYQWQQNGVNITGATSASYTTPTTVQGDSGAAFRCRVTNPFGNVTSNAAILNVVKIPTITTHPANQTVASGATATFSVVATGTAPLTYQWQKNGSDITGATSASYTTPATVQGDSGAAFRCRVTNPFGNVTSNAAILNVVKIPTITTHPANQTVALGSTATFSVVASGTAPLTYQWQKNGVNIAGATSASYTTPATVQGDSGAAFRCRVTNPFGNVTSNAAILNVVKIPTITTHPANQTVALGSTATFSVVATGTAPLTYQWQKNGVNIAGAASASYTTPATVQGDSGAAFRCRVTNPFGNVTSNAAILNVVKIPTITTHPANQTVALGSTATFSVVASGTAPLTYQWQKNGVNIAGATSSSYTTGVVSAADNGALYRCGVSNLAGTAYSNAAVLTVTSGARVAANLQVLYEFEEGAGTLVTDGSGVGTPIHLTIEKPKAVQWGAGLLRIKSKTKILSTGPASKLISAAMLTNEITVEAWVNADKQKQANILTLSQGKSLNFVLGQTNKDARGSSAPGNKGSFEMELRTSTTSTKGVLFSSGDRTVSIVLTHIVFTRNANGTVKFFLDGSEVASGMIPGTFGNWNSSYQLGIGGEGKEDWKGDLYLVAVYNRALTEGEVQQNFAAGPNASTPSGPDALANGSGMPEPAVAGQPSTFALHQNYPNPFNPSTLIRYEIPEPATVTLRVYNLLGQEVSTLVDARQAAGVFDVRFDASALTSGVYLYRLQAGHFVETRRLVLLR